MTVDNRVTVTLRELCPRDFYWFALVENDFPNMKPAVQALLIIAMLTDGGEEVLDEIPSSCVNPLIHWMMPELIEERIMKVDQWHELAFHLCKQRWDESIDWLETLPMSRVLLMLRIQTKFNQEQEREMKKNSRKRR